MHVFIMHVSMMHVFMMHMSRILDPDACVHDARMYVACIYDLRSLILMHVGVLPCDIFSMGAAAAAGGLPRDIFSMGAAAAAGADKGTIRLGCPTPLFVINLDHLEEGRKKYK